MRFRGFAALALFAVASFVAVGAFAHEHVRDISHNRDPEPLTRPTVQPPLNLKPTQRLITVLQTNDIHGHVESGELKGHPAGGLDFWAGTVNSIRQGVDAEYGERAGVLTVDAGDQFQGTLMSNYNEGELVFKAMDHIGYDAVVPGNHDYDFGPLGWLQDRVIPGQGDQDPRGALKKLTKLVKFPLVGANVYLRESLVDAQGEWVDMDEPVDNGTDPEDKVDWSRAVQPEFLRPYVIKTVAGVRVALIGLENSGTPTMTTSENVADLYFRDPFYTYLDIRSALEGRADVFVIVIHSGNALNERDASLMARHMTEYGNSWKKLGNQYGYDVGAVSKTSHVVDLVVAGHTHFVHDDRVNGVPVIQSGWGGTQFGRVDLIYDTAKNTVVTTATRGFAGVPLFHDDCGSAAADFCEANGEDDVAYESEPVIASPQIQTLMEAERVRIKPLANRLLGTADGVIERDRINENALANNVTDEMRRSSGADLAMVNTGGLRADIDEGTVTYAQFFEVLPFSNHGVVIGPVTTTKLMSLLERAVRTCGAYSALMQSGLKVRFRRDCSHAEDGKDPRAKVIKVETLAGKVIFDLREGGLLDKTSRFTIATFDFLADGGSGYSEFKGIPLKRDLGILREALVTHYLSHPAEFSSQIDRRWLELKSAP